MYIFSLLMKDSTKFDLYAYPIQLILPKDIYMTKILSIDTGSLKNVYTF